MNKNYDFVESEVSFDDPELNFSIIHNLPEDIIKAVVNWQARTKEYSPESFCKYINSKRERGLSDHYAFTVSEWNAIKNRNREIC